MLTRITRHLVVLIFAFAAWCHAADRRPNIIVIMADDMGYSDIGCYGGEILTPHLDRLASQGMRFTQFYNNAKCTTTRAEMPSEHAAMIRFDGRNARPTCIAL